jgi:tRNA modification GTPase
MFYHPDDTIAAIASAAGGAARGILRLSGPNVRNCLEGCFRSSDSISLANVTSATVIPGELSFEESRRALPCDLYYWPTASSYTRQPSAEIHTVGSPPLLEAALRRLCAAGARPAEPGEFTLRAFLAGRLDLTQAEAVLGVIDAGSQQEFQIALAQLAGGLAGPLNLLRDGLLDLLAHLEAGLDFVEEDIEFITPAELDEQLAEAASVVENLVEQMSSRAATGDVVRVALIGWPNVGKSSLFNALVGSGRAIVSPLPGTTRDYLTAKLDLDGVLCELIDTAGIEPAASDPLSIAAQVAMAAQHAQAHVQLLCLDSTRPLNSWEIAELARAHPSRLVVWTKVDQPLADQSPLPRSLPSGIATSSATQHGLDALRQQLRAAATSAPQSESQVVLSTAVRCRESLRGAAESLIRARAIVADRGGDELVAAELRAALDDLGQTVGAVYTDDVLDRIFSRFCIGK